MEPTTERDTRTLKQVVADLMAKHYRPEDAAEERKKLSCPFCEDAGLVYFPHIRNGVNGWYPLRCHCDAPADRHAVDRPIKAEQAVEGPRRWDRNIPQWDSFVRKDGRGFERDDLFNETARAQYEHQMTLHRRETAEKEKA